MIYTEEDHITDTQDHILTVQRLIGIVTTDLTIRGLNHDKTKLSEPEKSIFTKYTPQLDSCEFGSKSYYNHLSKVMVAVDNHYKYNSHHPEHYPNGISGMNLLDILEMFVDWIASSQKYDGCINKSIEVNSKRFDISDDLKQIFMNSTKMLDFAQE